MVGNTAVKASKSGFSRIETSSLPPQNPPELRGKCFDIVFAMEILRITLS